MKRLIIKFGGVVASLALMITTINVNMGCMMYAYQPELPDKAKSLRHF